MVGGLIQTASGSGLGLGTPLTKRSGWVVHAVLSTVVLRAITLSARQEVALVRGSASRCPRACARHCTNGKNDRQKVLAWPWSPNRPGNEGWYFKVCELSLGERIVIRDLRPAQRAGHAEVSEKLSGALARHWSSPIRVQGQDPGLDAMLQAALLDQPAGQGRVLPVRWT